MLMADPTTTHARMTRHTFAGGSGLRPIGPRGGFAASPSASSGSPMQPAWASQSAVRRGVSAKREVLAHLDLPRPRAHAAAAPAI
jgi:hypothetical protein